MTGEPDDLELDIAVVGGGQAAMAVGYYLRRTGLRFTLLDDQSAPGGAWRHTWPSLRLFSPAQWSSLPGWLMPRNVGEGTDEYPSRDAAIAYLAQYENRYSIPVRRPVRVVDVQRQEEHFRLHTDRGTLLARAVVSATGTWSNPVTPTLPGEDSFSGRRLHSSQYDGSHALVGRRIVVVGGGNSGAQIVAELSLVASVTWATLTPPHFLPDEVDGRYLFEQASARYRALQQGRTPDPPRSLGDVVMVPPVREARARGALESVPMFVRFTRDGVVWSDGREERVDVVIFATGFQPALSHLASLSVVGADGRVRIAPGGSGTRSLAEPRLWLVGYGEWTGFASATLIGVGRSARAAVEEIVVALN